MNISIETREQTSIIAIDGDLNIYGVNELKISLLEAVAAAEDTEVNLAEVQEFDSAALQVLVLAKRTANLQGKTLRITAHSNSVVNLFELYDLVSFFGDPLLISTQDPENSSGRNS